MYLAPEAFNQVKEKFKNVFRRKKKTDTQNPDTGGSTAQHAEATGARPADVLASTAVTNPTAAVLASETQRGGHSLHRAYPFNFWPVCTSVG